MAKQWNEIANFSEFKIIRIFKVLYIVVNFSYKFQYNIKFYKTDNILTEIPHILLAR